VPSAYGVFPHLDVAAEAAGESCIITAMIALQQHEPVPLMELTATTVGWVLTASPQGRNISVGITLADDYPAFNVSFS
jgi:hypothetical protein